MKQFRCSIYKLEASSKGDVIFSYITVSPPKNGYSEYLYWSNVKQTWSLGSKNIILGYKSDQTNQGTYAISIGTLSGNLNQGQKSISIGFLSGNVNQGAHSIAIGENTGENYQSTDAIAIGEKAGYNNQGTYSIAIGYNAGQTNQGQNTTTNASAVAIGHNAGLYNQATNAVAIGKNAGQTNQSNHAVAIGTNVGQQNQNPYTVSIGPNTGTSIQQSNTILINADPTYGMTASGTVAGTFINPIRGPMSSINVLSYITSTKEVTYTGSSKRYKHNIKPLSLQTENVYKLVPRKFKYNANGEEDIGLIAEEADKCDAWFAYKDKDGIPEGIKWSSITTYLIAEIKKLKIRKDTLKKEIVALKSRAVKT
jgi:hypothetical protein